MCLLARVSMAVRAAVAVAFAVALALVGGPRAGSSGQAGAPSGAPGSVLVTTDAVPLPTGATVAPLPANAPVRLSLTLAFSNSSRLAGLLAAVSDPTSPEYRHFVTFAQFVREFGPAASSVDEVEATLAAAGASEVALAPGGLAVLATLPAGAVRGLLGVSPVEYRSRAGSEAGFTSLGPLRLASGLAGRLQGIDGLAGRLGDGVTTPTLVEVRPPAPALAGPRSYVVGNSSLPGDWYIGTDYTQAYGATSLLPGNRSSVTGATFPAHVAVATLLASGYNSTASAVLPPWTPTVIDDYFNATFPSNGTWPLPSVTGVPVQVPGVSLPPPPGPFHGENDSTGFSVENSLDLEMAGSLAPGASLFNFYFSGELAVDPETSPYLPQYFADDLGAALAYNYSPERLAVVSCSFGLNDLNLSLWDAYLELAAAMGVTVVAASGDQGDAPSVVTGRAENASPLWPATAAFNTSGAISVGGASLELSGIPTGTYTSPPLQLRYDPSVEGIANASAWSDTSGGPGRYAGTEGGTSLTYAEPWWQFHSAAQPPIVKATEQERFPRLGRAGPDVAFSANATIAFVSAAPNGTPYFELLEGTSIAAPLFGGLLADVVAVDGGQGLGFLDPALYRIASYYQAYPGASDPFRPVVYGGNALFSAAPGWNPTTGWGGLYAPLLLAAVTNGTVANYSYTGPTPTLPGPSASRLPADELVALLAAAGTAVVVLAFVLASRARRRPSSYLTDAPYAGGPSPPVAPSWPASPQPPTGFVPTFACPYCGFDRPAEPGHCPRCGAM